jgi:hypothetical protein
MESLGGLVASAPDVTKLLMEMSFSSRIRRRVLFPDRGGETGAAPLSSLLGREDLVPTANDGTWAGGRAEHLDSLFLQLDTSSDALSTTGTAGQAVMPRWHGGLWNGTRAAGYIFPSSAPKVAPGGTTAYGTGLRIESDPPPFGATFAELRNLNPNRKADHLYPWIRDLLTPGKGLGAAVTGSDVGVLLAFFQSSPDAPPGGAAIGVTDWGMPFEEVDP